MRYTVLATALVLMVSPPAQADQFAIRLNSQFAGASPGLLSTLNITEIDSFAVDSNFYIIIDAPNEDYVEAFVYAVHRDALELHALDANWTHPIVVKMPIELKIGFLRSLACSFCVS